MDSKVMVVAHISDIHFGAMDPEQLYRELKKNFIKKLKKLPRLDMVVVQGDYFHFELSLNSRHAFWALRAIDDIKKLCRKRNVALRFVQGTRSHDRDQLDTIDTISEDLDIKIIRTVETEEYRGCTFLYLPEEYLKNPDDYYAEYMAEGNHYDYILGHGMFEEEAFNNNNNAIHLSDAPVFNSYEISQLGHIICFGHIHVAHTFNDIYYTGSFSRWQQGEEDPKGFIISLFNKENKKKMMLPIVNDLALKYITRVFDKYVKNLSADECIAKITELYNKLDIYKLRIIINEKNDSDYMGKVAIIQNHFYYNRLIDIEIKNTKINNDSEDENDSEIEDKYQYLFDESLTDSQKISQFIKDEKGYNLPPEKVDELLNMDILKILDTIMNETD